MGRFFVTANGAFRSKDGRAFIDVTSRELAAMGGRALVPLYVVNGEPNRATANAASAASNVATPTANDLRDLLSEADAILADSSLIASMDFSDSAISSMRRVSSSGAVSKGSSMNGSNGGAGCSGSESSQSGNGGTMPAFKKASASLPLSLAALALSLLSVSVCMVRF